MLSTKSSHKRKRSSARADASRKLGPSRWNVQLLSHTSRAAEKAPCPPDGRFSHCIEQHPFNQSLEVILPLTKDKPQQSVQSFLDKLEEATKSHKSYSAVVPLSLFLDPIFVTAYLRTGSLVALSHNSVRRGPEHQGDDIVCLDGQGTLVLSLCKDTYHTLGLTGKASHFSRKASGRAADRTSGADTRFVVELPLLSPSFVPGKNGYQQAQRRLRAWDLARAHTLATTQTIPTTHLTGKMTSGPASTSTAVDSTHATWDMLFVWSPSPETSAALTTRTEVDTTIHFPDTLVDPKQVRLLPLQCDGPTFADSVWIPALSNPSHSLSRPWVESTRNFAELEPSSSAKCTWLDFQTSLQEVVEWAGLVSLESNAVRTFAKPDDNCVYSPPTECQAGQVVRLRWSGGQMPALLSTSFVSNISAQVDQYCRTAARSNSSDADWAFLSCSGFPHAPLTWRSKVPLSRRFGLQPHQSNPPDSSDDISDLSSDDNVVPDMDLESSEESESSSRHRTVLRKTSKKSKKKSKRQIGKNETEHAFSPSTGETGWVTICLPPPSAVPTADATQSLTKSPSTNWLLVELVGIDTRS